MLFSRVTTLAAIVVTVALVSTASVAAGQPASPTPTTNSTPTATTMASPQPTATATPTAALTTTPSSRSASNQTGSTERIDKNTVLVSSEYRPNESAAFITLRSETAQAITLADAGAFLEGGKVPTRSIALGASETSTVELPVTVKDGYVGVSISTEETAIYSEIIERPTGGLEILKTLTTLGAWVAGAVVAFTWMVIAGWNVLRREEGKPEVAG